MAAPRILVTRAQHQASALADLLRAAGLEPILIPTIELAPPTDAFAALDTVLAHLDTFHWLLFTSANAVEAFARRCQVLSFLPPLSSIRCRIAAIGPATARALATIGLTPDLIPPQAVAESLAAALTPYAVQPDGSPTRFLLIRAEEARNVLEEQLKALKSKLTIAPAYRNVLPASSIPLIQNLFSTPASYPDAITFTSSSTVANFLALLEAANTVLPPDILRISIGPITSQTLCEQGFPPQAEATESTIHSLVEKVIQTLQLP